MADKKLSFAIFGNKYKALESVRIWEVLDFLARHDAEVYIEDQYYHALSQRLNEDVNVAGVFESVNFDTDYVISMGGDGTFLDAASKVGPKEIPILGVNMGRLGFLANVLPSEILDALQAIYDGQFTIEDRSVIKIETEGEPLEGNPFALNDIALLKRDTASMITVRASVNGEYLVTYQADGIIVATPTGSTAYSLSNGGPIMVPGSNIMCLTPVAPHSLNIRPIVISDDSVVTLKVESRSHNFLAAIDGRSEKLKEGTTVTVRKAPYVVKIIKLQRHRYFSTLREKMMWGADTRETHNDQ